MQKIPTALNKINHQIHFFTPGQYGLFDSTVSGGKDLWTWL